MKKRKPPIIAVTILCVLAAVVAGFNYRAGLDPNAPANAPAPGNIPEAPQGKARPEQSVSSTAAGVKSLLGSAPTPATAKPAPKRQQGMMSKMPPTILSSQPANTKPVPNDSSISSQWYQPDSSRASQK